MSCVSIEQLLGGSAVVGRTIKNTMDMYEAAQSGLPKKALENLGKSLGFTAKKMASVLQVTERTLQRKSTTDILDTHTSEKILQIADVYSKGCEIFGDPEPFSEWLQLENRALNNKQPIDLLASQYGARMVLDELGRIAYGITA